MAPSPMKDALKANDYLVKYLIHKYNYSKRSKSPFLVNKKENNFIVMNLHFLSYGRQRWFPKWVCKPSLRKENVILCCTITILTLALRFRRTLATRLHISSFLWKGKSMNRRRLCDVSCSQHEAAVHWDFYKKHVDYNAVQGAFNYPRMCTPLACSIIQQSGSKK